MKHHTFYSNFSISFYFHKHIKFDINCIKIININILVNFILFYLCYPLFFKRYAK